MFARFGLILMVNHACNLPAGTATPAPSSAAACLWNLACAVIDPALRSLQPGGVLELGFFGGEPLIEAESILHWIDYASRCADDAGDRLELGLTTNGTLTQGAAWSVLTHPDLSLAISHDGLPEIHDSQRVTVDGHGSSAQVLKMMDRLLAARQVLSRGAGGEAEQRRPIARWAGIPPIARRGAVRLIARSVGTLGAIGRGAAETSDRRLRRIVGRVAAESGDQLVRRESGRTGGRAKHAHSRGADSAPARSQWPHLAGSILASA